MQPDSQETLDLLDRVRAGDARALEMLIARHRPMLLQFVKNRLDPKLQPRVDASDIIQEAHLEITCRIKEYLDRKPAPFRLWIYRTAYENLIRASRKHIVAGRRSVDREVPMPENSSVLIAQRLLGSKDWPGQRLAREEIHRRVVTALANLEPIDREILQLRGLEELDNEEAAQVLDIEPRTASKRFGRALLRLREVLKSDNSESQL